MAALSRTTRPLSPAGCPHPQPAVPARYAPRAPAGVGRPRTRALRCTACCLSTTPRALCSARSVLVAVSGLVKQFEGVAPVRPQHPDCPMTHHLPVGCTTNTSAISCSQLICSSVLPADGGMVVGPDAGAGRGRPGLDQRVQERAHFDLLGALWRGHDQAPPQKGKESWISAAAGPQAL